MVDINVGDVFTTNLSGDVQVLSLEDGQDVKVQFLETGYQKTVKKYNLLSGNIRGKGSVKICGIGINDSNYKTAILEELPKLNGKRKSKVVWKCPFYSRWFGIIYRCYSDKELIRHPTYKGCIVCEEWLTFSNFRKWMVEQDWEGNHLDKDLLVHGNKIYSPATCVFIPQKLNKFILDRSNGRGQYLLGVSWDDSLQDRKYTAKISDPFQSSKSSKHLGRFSTELEAHLAWKKQKHLYACELADSVYVDDVRVAEALRNRYKNYTVLEEHIS